MTDSAASVLAEQDHWFPGGGQNSARASSRYLKGVHPCAVKSARGVRLVDIDDQSWIDYHLGFGAVMLGHGNQQITAACTNQVKSGPILTAPTTFETQVAAIVIDWFPWHEQLRFVKTGADACTAAVRLARHTTGRNQIISLGYHGWHEWARVSASHVHASTNAATLSLPADDITKLVHTIKDNRRCTACVILDAKVFATPKPSTDGLREVRNLCSENGIVLIFDEVVSSFRTQKGSLAAHTGVHPDLSCFGKAMANGYPLAAVAGSRAIMHRITEIGLTGTFFPDAVALAAASACLPQITAESIAQMIGRGIAIWKEIEAVIDAHSLADLLCVDGIPAALNVAFEDGSRFPGTLAYEAIAMAMSAEGVLWQGFHALSPLHGDPELDALMKGYRNGLARLAQLRARAGDTALQVQL